MDKEHKDPEEIDLEAPRLALYMHKTWKKHQKTLYWVTSTLLIEVLSNTIERYHSLRNTPSLLYSESCSGGQWRSHIRQSICVTSSSSKCFLET